MKRTTGTAYLAIVALGAGAAAFAPNGDGPFDLSWNTIDAGGGTSVGSAYELTGTIGQHDPGEPMTGGDFALTGGFWAGAGEDGPTCPEDLDGDDQVGFSDLLRILGEWGACPAGGSCPEDLDTDGIVGFGDLLIILASWGPCE